MQWIGVKDRLPKCDRKKDSFGVPVLILPREKDNPHGAAFYGKRITDKPCFYICGHIIQGVTHWMPLPDGPEEEKEATQ